jgi:hypothetical protein
MNKNKKNILKKIYMDLKCKKISRHFLSYLGYNIFLIKKLSLGEENEYNSIKSNYFDILNQNNLNNLLEENIKYAIRLIEYPGKLEYEEMHKLISLCDENFALKELGLFIDNSIFLEFEKKLKNKILSERILFSVINEKFEEWKKDIWWYNLYKSKA